MKLAKILKRLSGLCFLLLWIPFAIVMINGPFAIAFNGPEAAERAMNTGFFSGVGIWMVLLFALVVGSAVFMVASILIGGMANRRVINTGQDAKAKILSIGETGTRINGNPVVDIALEIQPATQPAFMASTRQTVSIVHLPSFQPGRIVNVKYIPGTDQVAIVGSADV